MRYRYNGVNFLYSFHNKHPIDRQSGKDTGICRERNSNFSLASITEVLRTISRYIGPRYNDIRQELATAFINIPSKYSHRQPLYWLPVISSLITENLSFMYVRQICWRYIIKHFVWILSIWIYIIHAKRYFKRSQLNKHLLLLLINFALILSITKIPPKRC